MADREEAEFDLDEEVVEAVELDDALADDDGGEFDLDEEVEEAPIDEVDEAAAAVRMQAARRGQQGRQAAKARAETSHLVKQEARAHRAAIRVQAKHRGQQARSEAMQRQTAATKVQAVRRGQQECQATRAQWLELQLAQEEAAEDAAAVRMQAARRGQQVRWATTQQQRARDHRALHSQVRMATSTGMAARAGKRSSGQLPLAPRAGLAQFAHTDAACQTAAPTADEHAARHLEEIKRLQRMLAEQISRHQIDVLQLDLNPRGPYHVRAFIRLATSYATCPTSYSLLPTSHLPLHMHKRMHALRMYASRLRSCSQHKPRPMPPEPRRPTASPSRLPRRPVQASWGQGPVQASWGQGAVQASWGQGPVQASRAERRRCGR